MNSIYKLLSQITVLGLLMVGLTPITNAQVSYEATLSGSNEVPAITTTANGSITATLTGTELVIEGSFSGLTGDYAASHIHIGMAGQNGGVLAALTPTVDGDNRGGTFVAGNNTFTLTSGQVDTLNMQGLYVNIHSATYAGGELRGQIVPDADTHYRTNLSGAFEVPAAKTMAYGGAVFQLQGDSLIVSGSFSNLSDTFSASHLHVGAAGSNGGVAFTLNVDAAGDNLSGTYLPANNRFLLTAEQKTALLNREFYVNIHTAAFGGGELRGQVTPPVTASFYTSLSGSAEIPSANTAASGALVVELVGDSVFASGSFQNLEGDFDANVAGGSHIHAGNAGINGGVDFLLTADVDAGLKMGSYAATDNRFELTSEQKATLLNRGYYVNIHTTTFGAGELRGQILGDARSYFRTNLAGIHEVQPVETAALGALNVELNGSTTIVTGGFSGLESEFDANVAGGAHLHTASVSGNGDVSILLNTTTAMDNLSGSYDVSMNTFTLTEEQVTSLYSEGLYANLHTTGNAAGELRGQLLFGNNTFPDEVAITSPADAATLQLSADMSTVFTATWETGTDPDGSEVSNIWQLSTDANFSTLAINASTGADAMFSATHGELDALLAGLGVTPGASATVYHRVVLTDGSDESYGPSSSLTITRAELPSIDMVAALSGSNEVPAITTTANGSITATLTGMELVIEGSFSGLTGDYAASHIHIGMAGQNGGVLATLTPTVDGDNRGGTFVAGDNTFMLSAGQIDTLMMQGLYVNIHSSTYAGGELRGQIVPAADAHFKANLSGAFEIPAVKTMAYGGVVLQLDGDSLFVSGSFSNLSDTFSASHLHVGAAGSNGGVAFTLNVDAAGDNLSGTYLPSNNRFLLTAEQKTALMNREFYVNIHTAAFGGGELRGQVTPPVTASFYASLSGTAEVPSIKSGASGAIVFELQGDSLFASGSFTGLEGDFDASIAGGSHIHMGHAGENGGVSLLINADVDTELRSGTYMASNNRFELTAEQKAALIDRMFYVNIHTTAFGSGELRGQILGDATAYFKTKLAGVHEIQPIVSTGNGALNVEVAGNTAIVTGGFSELTSAFDAAVAGGAHLHTGVVSVNGGIAANLNSTVSMDTAGVYEAGMNMITLTTEQLTALYNEGLYANIHTTGFGAGELRGQLLFGDNMFPDSSEITSPAEGGLVTLTGSSSTQFEATWTASADENEINYIWQLSTDADFNNIVVNASVGSETSFTADFGVLDALLADLGIQVGATTTIYHRVIASDGSNNTMSEPRSAMLERGTITSNEGIDQPLEFGLDQNYPNPFNPTTTIGFTLSESGNATLKVYNMLGQEVATLANERLNSGSHTFSFDASALSSGMYIYRLQAQNQTITKRMMLIK